LWLVCFWFEHEVIGLLERYLLHSFSNIHLSAFLSAAVLWPCGFVKKRARLDLSLLRISSTPWFGTASR